MPFCATSYALQKVVSYCLHGCFSCSCILSLSVTFKLYDSDDNGVLDSTVGILNFPLL